MRRLSSGGMAPLFNRLASVGDVQVLGGDGGALEHRRAHSNDDEGNAVPIERREERALSGRKREVFHG